LLSLIELEELARQHSADLTPLTREGVMRLEVLEEYERTRPALRVRLGNLLVKIGLKLDPAALPPDQRMIEATIARHHANSF
jgi:ParB-like chromosome segregation protein Spo0J